MTAWQDVSDLCIPSFYLQFLFGFLNNVRSGPNVYSDTAFEKCKEVILSIGQRVFRHQNQVELRRVLDLQIIPRF